MKGVENNNKIMGKNKISEQEMSEMSRKVFTNLISQLKSGKIVKIRGFGTFSLSHHKERNGVNPKTGSKIKIPGKNAIKLNLSKKLKKSIQESAASSRLNK